MRILRFRSELQSQNENAESVEFLGKVNSGQKNVSRPTFFAMKSIKQIFKFNKNLWNWLKI